VAQTGGEKWSILEKKIKAAAALSSFSLSPTFESDFTSAITINNKKEVHIYGNGAVINAAGKDRLFVVSEGSTLRLFGPLVLMNGSYEGNSESYGGGTIMHLALLLFSFINRSL
jgi:hypothetical protein